jgi:predicted transcriptional regulator
MAFHLKQLFTGRAGTRAALHDLEAAVMDVLWEQTDAEVSVRDIVEALRPSRNLAYTTVMTTMDRLAKRELLVRRKEGRAWLYRAAMERPSFLALIAQQTLDGLPPGSRRSALRWLVDEASQADAEELDFLAELIERRRAERGER